MRDMKCKQGTKSSLTLLSLNLSPPPEEALDKATDDAEEISVKSDTPSCPQKATIKSVCQKASFLECTTALKEKGRKKPSTSANESDSNIELSIINK